MFVRTKTSAAQLRRMNKEGFSKLNWEIGALIEMLIGAYAGYFHWMPMMFNEDLVQRINAEKRGYGFLHFRNLAYRMLILDLVNLCADDDKNGRTPSIKVIWEKLATPTSKAFLEELYANHGLRSLRANNPEYPRRVVRIHKELARKSFEEVFDETGKLVGRLLLSPTLKGYREVRDKLLAHRELRLEGGKYATLDIGTLGLKYGQERELLDQARDITDRFNHMVRNASFGWDTVEKNETKNAGKFWGLTLEKEYP